jgi:transcriptional regulator with XRE-family HTH domain
MLGSLGDTLCVIQGLSVALPVRAIQATARRAPTGEPTFGDEPRRLREQRGLSLKKFASLVLYDPGYLSKIENGLKPPTATLAKTMRRGAGYRRDTVRIGGHVDRIQVVAGDPQGAGLDQRAVVNALRRYGDAVTLLDKALAAFEPAMHRHRCTALIDRAEAHLAGSEVDASCVDATAALGIAAHTEHALSVQRVHRLAEAALPTKAVATRRLWAEVLAVSPDFRHSSQSH